MLTLQFNTSICYACSKQTLRVRVHGFSYVRSIPVVLFHLLIAISGQQTNLEALFNNMGSIKIIELSNLHAITATLEEIVTYLVSKTPFWSCQDNQLIPCLDFQDLLHCVCNSSVLGLLLPANIHGEYPKHRFFGLEGKICISAMSCRLGEFFLSLAVLRRWGFAGLSNRFRIRLRRANLRQSHVTATELRAPCYHLDQLIRH